MIHSSSTLECPTPAEWHDAIRGRTTNSRWLEIESHLLGCPRCEATVDSMTERSDTVVRNLCQSPANPVDEDGFQKVYEELIGDPQVCQFAQPPCVPDLPMQFGKYELQSTLGQGANGSVFRALHKPLNRVVAIKLLRPDHDFDPMMVDRFTNEMRALGALDHPNVVRASDAGEVDGQHYLAMEYVPGVDLSATLDLVGSLSPPDASEVLRQAALGLAYLHEHGFVHRDVKPSNLLLTADGRVRLLDLGLVQSMVADETATPTMPHGTADYMSPEQWRAFGSVSASSDLYSLGCTLAKLLTKSPPYRPLPEGFPTKFAAHCEAPIPDLRQLRDDIPDGLQRLFRKMMAKNANERFASAGDLAEQLAPYARGADLRRLAVSTGQKPARHEAAAARQWTRRQWIGLAAGASGAAVLGAAGAARFRDGKSISTVVEPAIWRDLRPANPAMLLGSVNPMSASRWQDLGDGIRVVDGRLAMLNLGQPMMGHFRMGVEFPVPLTRSFAGWIYNYHRESEAELTIHRFRALEFVRSHDDSEQPHLRWRGIRLRESADGIREESFVWAESEVSEPPDLARLEIALGTRNMPQVWWCERLCTTWQFTAEGLERSNMPPGEATPGAIGLICGAADTQNGKAIDFVKPRLMYSANS